MRSNFIAFISMASLTGGIACSDSSSPSSSSPTSDAGASDDGGSDNDEGVSAFDACTLLSQTEAQDVMAYELTPCRQEPVIDAVRHVWESPSSAPIAATGSVNVTVEKAGKSFEEAAILCGANGQSCLTIDGVGEKALLHLKFTWVLVKKGSAVFAAQCEKPGQIMANEDSIIQAQLGSESKEADLSIRTDGSEWRNSSSCSLAIAKIIAGKVP